MQDFQFLVTDDRYAVPSVMFVQSRDRLAARSLAQRMLEFPHYHAIEVCVGKERLFIVNERAAASAA